MERGLGDLLGTVCNIVGGVCCVREGGGGGGVNGEREECMF